MVAYLSHMKNILAWIAVIFMVHGLHAENFATRDGDMYTNATVKRVEPDGIVVADADGLRKLKFSNLSPELQQKYGYDPQKATQFSNAIAASSIASQTEMVKFQNSQQAEKIAAQPTQTTAASSSPNGSSAAAQTTPHPHKGVESFESHIHGCGGTYEVLSCDDTGLTCKHKEHYKTRTEYKTDTTTEHIPYYYLPPSVRSACGFPPPSINDPM